MSEKFTARLFKNPIFQSAFRMPIKDLYPLSLAIPSSEVPMLQTQTLPMSFAHPVNVVPLEEVLSSYEAPFQAAVREALVWEGFEFTKGGLPNLQLAREILTSIRWVGESGYDHSWNSFRKFLEWADHQGVLVNLESESPVGLRD